MRLLVVTVTRRLARSAQEHDGGGNRAAALTRARSSNPRMRATTDGPQARPPTPPTVPTPPTSKMGWPCDCATIEKMGYNRVLAINMAFPVITKYQDPSFLGNFQVYLSNPCGQLHHKLQLNFHLSCLPRSIT